MRFQAALPQAIKIWSLVQSQNRGVKKNRRLLLGYLVHAYGSRSDFSQNWYSYFDLMFYISIKTIFRPWKSLEIIRTRKLFSNNAYGKCVFAIWGCENSMNYIAFTISSKVKHQLYGCSFINIKFQVWNKNVRNMLYLKIQWPEIFKFQFFPQ